MYRYAIIDDESKVINVVMASAEFESSEHIRTDIGNINDYYDGATFVTPKPDNVFEFIITALSTNDPTAIIKENLTGVLCKEGSTINITIEARIDGELIPINDYFRTPITASDGREQIILTLFSNGICQAEYKVPESGFWSITQADINKNTDNSIIFLFKGLNIDVAG